MKWPADISLFINDDGPPIDIWHDGVCGGPMLTANSMDAAQAIIGAIEELHGLRAEAHDLRLALAAERLDPTAGADLDYHLINGVYIRRVEGGHIGVEMRDEPKGRWRAYRFARGLVVPPWREVWADNARTAMREANEKEKP